MASLRRVRGRTPRILLAIAALAILVGGAGVAVGTSASGWLMERLAGTDLAIDRAALGGAVTALGIATMLVGGGLIGLALALHLARPWARPVAAAVAFALLAAAVGCLAAVAASFARDPQNGPAYMAGGIGLAVLAVALGVVLVDAVMSAERDRHPD